MANKLICELSKVDSVATAMKLLDEGGEGVLFFVDHDNKFLGMTTDGDFRRAILNGVTDINEVLNKNPTTMPSTATKNEIKASLKLLHRKHMPLIDEKGKLASVYVLGMKEVTTKKDKVVIMAGGLGSRLGELTKTTPKPMLHVGGQPMLKHLVDQFSEHGFKKFIFCVNYKKEIIKDYFKDGSKLGVEIEYVEEEAKLGTAGALSLINSERVTENFFVINADVLTNLDFSLFMDYHVSKSTCLTMAVREFEQQIPFGVIERDLDGRVTAIKEKPISTYNVNAGIYILSKSVLRYLNYNEYADMPDFISLLNSKNLKTHAYQVEDYWLDIGRKSDLEKAQQDLTI
ncbi:nucleotidyltransferase family protein [Alteromonas sp.]|uniref:nucleotidyltransferase family protein n=1 Tax=Alteromonas sp. TaxID=232 RepID=UPI003519B7E2